MAELAILNHTGDEKIRWSYDDPDQVKAARSRFDELARKGWLAFRTPESGGPGEQIRSFDPYAESIVMVPPLRGG